MIGFAVTIHLYHSVLLLAFAFYFRVLLIRVNCFSFAVLLSYLLSLEEYLFCEMELAENQEGQ